MRRRILPPVLGTLCLLAGGWGIQQLLERAHAVPEPSRSLVSTASAATLSSARARDQQIRFFAKRAKEDPFSAGDRTRLAALYLQRSRATGNYDDVLQAEALARRSLELRQLHNAGTYPILAVTLLDQHRFTEAWEAARRLVELEPEEPSHRALLGQTQLELGKYDEARATFASLEPAAKDLAIAADLARWEEISGHPERARALLRFSLDRALTTPNLAPEQLAVFYFRVADFELRAGRLEDAEAALRSGLRVHPGDYRLLAEMARLEALRHRWKEAIRYGDQAISLVLNPATLGTMSDAYAALGDSARAAEYARTMEVAIRNQKKAYHREWSLFLLDHDSHVAEVLAQVSREVRTRPDIYGYDLLAWALHKQGRDREAKAAMAEALRMGTQDAALFFHAGVVARALGDDAAAERSLRRALELNPRFHPTQPALARAVLDSIRTEAR